jgi:hypothetical protein
VAPTEIVDLYLAGTRLRLRQVTSADGTRIYKLGQKIRTDEPPWPAPGAVDVTTDDRFSGGSLARTGLVHIGPF